MNVGLVIGHATATVKHSSLAGWRLLVVQPLTLKDEADGDPVLALDNLGARRGDRVIVTSDGTSVRDMVGTYTTPVRWAVIGLQDT